MLTKINKLAVFFWIVSMLFVFPVKAADNNLRLRDKKGDLELFAVDNEQGETVYYVWNTATNQEVIRVPLTGYDDARVAQWINQLFLLEDGSILYSKSAAFTPRGYIYRVSKDGEQELLSDTLQVLGYDKWGRFMVMQVRDLKLIDDSSIPKKDWECYYGFYDANFKDIILPIIYE